MRTLVRWCAGLAMLLAGSGAGAAISCSAITSPGWSYDYVNGTTGGTQTSFTMTCNRGSTSDATSMSYSVTVDYGLHKSGNSTRAQLVVGGTTYSITYGLFKSSCAGTAWRSTTTITGTVSWPSRTTTGTSSDTRQFWSCISAAQTATGSGRYTDTVTMTAKYNPGTGNTNVTGTIPISIYAPAACTISPSPSNVSMTYPAFSASAVVATTSFGATCTSGMPYSLAVSPASASLVGVNYNVALSAASASGTGAVQTYTVTVTAPAGQAGTCGAASCPSAPQSHTLTISY